MSRVGTSLVRVVRRVNGKAGGDSEGVIHKAGFTVRFGFDKTTIGGLNIVYWLFIMFLLLAALPPLLLTNAL